MVDFPAPDSPTKEKRLIERHTYASSCITGQPYSGATKCTSLSQSDGAFFSRQFREGIEDILSVLGDSKSNNWSMIITKDRWWLKHSSRVLEKLVASAVSAHLGRHLVLWSIDRRAYENGEIYMSVDKYIQTINVVHDWSVLFSSERVEKEKKDNALTCASVLGLLTVWFTEVVFFFIAWLTKLWMITISLSRSSLLSWTTLSERL